MRHRIAGIDREIEDRVLELGGIGERRAKLRRQFDRKPDLFAQRSDQQFFHAPDQLVYIHRLGIERLTPGERQQPVGEAGGAIGRSDRAVHEPLDVFVAPGVDTALQDLHRADDGRQHVVEVVRDAAGELADRFHFLGMAQRLLGLAQGVFRLALGGDVAADRLKEIVRRHRAPFDTPARAVARTHVELDALRRRSARQRLELGSKDRAFFGNDEVQDVGPDQLRLLPAQQMRPGRVDRADRSVEAGNHHDVGRQRPHAVAVRGALGDPPLQRLVEQAQRIDRHAPLVDVAQDGGDESASLARPARRRRLEVARRAVLAAGRELDRPADRHAVEDAPEGLVPLLGVLEQEGHRPADQLVRGIAELAGRRRIDHLDHACRIERQDGVGGAADDGVVARVLALAQDAFAPRHDGDVDDLQQAAEIRPVADRPDRNVVQQLASRARAQREDRCMQGMGDQARRSELERLRDRRGEPRRYLPGEQFVERPAFGGRGRNAAGGFHPDVPADDPTAGIEKDQPDIDGVEDAAVDLLLRSGHSRAPSLPPCVR